MPEATQKQELCLGVFVKDVLNQVFCLIHFTVNTKTGAFVRHKCITQVEGCPKQIAKHRLVAIPSGLASQYGAPLIQQCI